MEHFLLASEDASGKFLEKVDWKELHLSTSALVEK